MWVKAVRVTNAGGVVGEVRDRNREVLTNSHFDLLLPNSKWPDSNTDYKAKKCTSKDFLLVDEAQTWKILPVFSHIQ